MPDRAENNFAIYALCARVVPLRIVNKKLLRGARLMAEDLSASPPKPQRQPERQSTEQQGQNSENYELGRIHGKAMKRSEA
jgi:hypothetical protein